MPQCSDCSKWLLLKSDMLFYFPEQAESATTALSCSGMIVGTQPIRFAPGLDCSFKSLTKFDVTLRSEEHRLNSRHVVTSRMPSSA